MIGYEIVAISETVVIIREPMGDGHYREKSVRHGLVHNNLTLMHRIINMMVII